MNNPMQTIPLPGLPTTPFGYYLAALGVLRAVSKKYPQTRGWWHDGEVFCLRVPFDAEGLVNYLSDEWAPTPLLRPWNPDPDLDWKTLTLIIPQEQRATLTNAIKNVEDKIKSRRDNLKSVGGSKTVIAKRIKTDPELQRLQLEILETKHKFLSNHSSTTSPRWSQLCAGLQFSNLQVLASEKNKTLKEKLDNRKAELKEKGGSRVDITKRVNADEECKRIKNQIAEIEKDFNPAALLVEIPSELTSAFWTQLAIFEGEEKPRYNPIMGAGGSDGQRDFSVMFQEALELTLLDPKTAEQSKDWLKTTLFGKTSTLPDFKGGSWFASSIKQHNSGQSGFFSEGKISPWTYLFAVQGILAFSGSVARRLGSKAKPEAVFPFIVTAPSPVEDAKRLNVFEKTKAEVWTPLWSRPASFQEILWMFRKGRARQSKKAATAPAIMAQAALGIQVDRGITSFVRHSLDHTTSNNTFEVVPLGECKVGGTRSEAAGLIAELDSWLSNLPWDGETSKRYTGLRRRIEDAILAACQNPNEPDRFLRILQTAAQIDSRIGKNKDLRALPRAQPVPPLSPRWFLHCHDGTPSPELVIAASIASLKGDKAWNEATNYGELDPDRGVPPLRGNLFGIALFHPWSSDRQAWAAYPRHRNARAVWTGLRAGHDLAAVLRRRCLDSNETQPLALDGTVWCPPQYVMALLNGNISLGNVAALVPAMSLINWERIGTPYSSRADLGIPENDWSDFYALDPAYRLLKLLFQPRNFSINRGNAKAFSDRDHPPRSPQALARLLAGDLPGALTAARPRLRACGLNLIEWEEASDPNRAERIAAALLVPISTQFLQRALEKLSIPKKSEHTSNVL